MHRDDCEVCAPDPEDHWDAIDDEDMVQTLERDLDDHCTCGDRGCDDCTPDPDN